MRFLRRQGDLPPLRRRQPQESKRAETVTYPGGYGYSLHGELETVTIPVEGSISVNQYQWAVPEKLTLPGGSTQNKSYDYQYDKENRLTLAKTDSGGVFGTDTETFTLDSVGNRIAHSQQSGAWSYDANNRLIQRGNGACGTSDVVCYDYDELGNLSKKTEAGKITQYRYNALNQLIAVMDGTNQLIARYGYDFLSRRIWKEQFRDIQGAALTPATRTYFLYGDEGLLAEATQAITLHPDQSVTASASPVISTQYGPRPDSTFTTGTLFIKTMNSNGSESVAYYQHDHLETPIQATDKAGNVVWAAHYAAFGQATISTPAASVNQPTINSKLRFPGQYADAETGLHYNYFRDYDPAIGRYIQSDPIGLKGGINTYGYVGGSPLLEIDPLGLDSWSPYASAGVGGGIHLAVIGVNVTCGTAIRAGGTSGQICRFCTVCVRFGPGLFVGGGVSAGGGGVSGDATNLGGWSNGAGADAGWGAAVGGSVSASVVSGSPLAGTAEGVASLGGTKGLRWGGGFGASIGIEYCNTKITCTKNCNGN